MTDYGTDTHPVALCHLRVSKWSLECQSFFRAENGKISKVQNEPTRTTMNALHEAVEITPLTHNGINAAKRLGVSFGELKNLVAKGIVKPIRFPGCRPRYAESHLAEIVKEWTERG